jgi:hypothetical protein
VPVLFESSPKDNGTTWHRRDFERQLKRKRPEMTFSISLFVIFRIPIAHLKISNLWLKIFEMRNRALNFKSCSSQLPFQVSPMPRRFVSLSILWEIRKMVTCHVHNSANQICFSVRYLGAPLSPIQPSSKWGRGIEAGDFPFTDQFLRVSSQQWTNVGSNTLHNNLFKLACSLGNIGDACVPGVARKLMGLGWRACAPQNIAKAEFPSSQEASRWSNFICFPQLVMVGEMDNSGNEI